MIVSILYVLYICMLVMMLVYVSKNDIQYMIVNGIRICISYKYI